MYSLKNVQDKLPLADQTTVMSHMLQTGSNDVKLALQATGLIDKFEKRLRGTLVKQASKHIVASFAGTKTLAKIGALLALKDANTFTVTFHMRGKYVWCASATPSRRQESNLPQVVQSEFLLESMNQATVQEN